MECIDFISLDPRGSAALPPQMPRALRSALRGDDITNFEKIIKKNIARFQKNQKELLLKTLPKTKEILHIVDATAGLGRDMLVFMRTPHTLSIIERHPKLFELLQKTLQQLSLLQSKKTNLTKIKLYHQNSIHFLKELNQTTPIDIIYLDPMFPERKKSALVKKEMQLLQQWVGKDEDAFDLAEQSIKIAKNRVIIKRPHHAPALLPNPSYTLSGKIIRYDIYLT